MKTFITTIIFLICFSAFSFDVPDLWTNGYYNQTKVKTPKDITIEAQVSGNWMNFALAYFPENFMKWNVKRRLKAIEEIENHQRPAWAGPHNGIVATHGALRTDSLFSLNNAVKGMGFLPKRGRIENLISLLNSTIDSPFKEKLAVLKDLYNRPNYWFDLSAHLSLELYSEPGFVTQSFLNQASNPVSTIVFLDVPSFKIKSITQLLDPNNPTLKTYEKRITEYANLIHSYFHGEFTKQFIAVVYWSIEIYDNSPGRSNARGTRIVPPML